MKQKQYRIEFIDMSEKEYENNAQINGGEYETKIFGEGFTIEDFYNYNYEANIVLEDMGNGWYTYTRVWDEGRYFGCDPDEEGAEKRYVYVRKFEEVTDEEEEEI